MIKYIFIGGLKHLTDEQKETALRLVRKRYGDSIEILPAYEEDGRKPLIELGNNIAFMQLADVYVNIDEAVSREAMAEDEIAEVYDLNIVKMNVCMKRWWL